MFGHINLVYLSLEKFSLYSCEWHKVAEYFSFFTPLYIDLKASLLVLGITCNVIMYEPRHEIRKPVCAYAKNKGTDQLRRW